MTQREGLEDLAARCEAATGPDPMLDYEINYTVFTRRIAVRKFTASLDAAMTLVPEGWVLHFLQDTEYDNPAERRWSVSLRPRQGQWDGTPEGAEAWTWAFTPALALTAAALRARATLSEGARKGEG